jgi:acyl dehydratase
VPLDYDLIMGLPPIETAQHLTERDTILYALGVGVAAENPTDPQELQFVYEAGLKALPTMASVMAYPGFWAKEPRYRLNWQQVLAGEQSVEIHRPLPVATELHSLTTIDAIFDKGPDKGAVLYSSRKVIDRATGEAVATVRQATFARADGGFGGSSDGQPAPHPEPETAPDLGLEASTRKDQALLYRLSGDSNPLHADPKVAAAAGFAIPIFHGMGTFGVVGRTLLQGLCGNEPERLKRLDARFSSPVYPGETLKIDVWRQGREQAAFRVSVPARGVTVLRNGLMELAA